VEGFEEGCELGAADVVGDDEGCVDIDGEADG
jgi:hypothetical protein